MIQQLGRYHIEDLLGEGSFAWVYRALDEGLERAVALKVLKPVWLSDQQALGRFRQEAKTMAKLHHPNIAIIYEVGEAEGQVFLAQFLVEGETLAARLARGPLTWTEMLGVLRPVASALDYAHQQDIIHRDIKPSNILLNQESLPYLSDFGLVRAAEGSVALSSSSGGMIGTPPYMAPELWEGKKATIATDVYALSCVVVEMLTGRVLFEGSTPAAVMRQHLISGPQFPEKWPVEVPAGLTDVLRQGLAENPVERVDRAGDLAETLAALPTSTMAAPAPKQTQTAQQAVEAAQTGQQVAIGEIGRAVAEKAKTERQDNRWDAEKTVKKEAALITIPLGLPLSVLVGLGLVLLLVVGAIFISLRGDDEKVQLEASPMDALVAASPTDRLTSTPTLPAENFATEPLSPTTAIATATEAAQIDAPIVPPTQTPTHTLTPIPTNSPSPEPATPTRTPTSELSETQVRKEWSTSGHADTEAWAFNRWNEDDPPQIPESCAKCHSLPGFLDFIGADGSQAGQVNKAAPIGTVIECEVCHNEVIQEMDTVVMPSGVGFSHLGREVACVQCHQGRQSTESVNGVIADVRGEDVVSEDIGFVNVHYYAAAATLYGGAAKGGYQYKGKGYVPKFSHVDDFDTCVECHDSHNLQVKVMACEECHKEVSDITDLKDIRPEDALVDYDGDGNTAEGIYYEIKDLQELLYKTIRDYARGVSGTPIVYDASNYPYFFTDNNANGKPDDGEINSDNIYQAWTPRLLKAAYNYQVSIKDPGGYTHNGKYILQLLYDSIEDLNQSLPKPIDLDNINRR